MPATVMVSTAAPNAQPEATLTAAPVADPLPPFQVDYSQPFSTATSLTLAAWSPQPYAGPALTLPLAPNQIANTSVLAGFTLEQQKFLRKNGFVVLHTQEDQFGDIRVATALRTGQPYYLTTDAAFHALHLLFDDTLKALERETLAPEIKSIVQATLDEVSAQKAAVEDPTLAGETTQAIAYLSVGLRLLDDKMPIDSAVADQVSRQVDQIMAGGGRSNSVLFPDFEDDYGAYKPVGHYVGDPTLEAYFRAMTWFGRVHFRLTDPSNPNFVPSRVPLIVTAALRRAHINAERASDVWAHVEKILNFLVGPSDDAGPLEYAALMDAIYGNTANISDLADQTRWTSFLQQSGQLPAPQINSLFVSSTATLTPEKGWRFMGQRFTLDAFVFQNLIFDKVKKKADGTRRVLPTGLDVMAAFGSRAAQQTLRQRGDVDFPGYLENLGKLQNAVQTQVEAQWLARFYDTWLYALRPVVADKLDAFPAYMRTDAWAYKDLNTALGSWAELKHDTVLYTKMSEGAGGGGPPMSGLAPSYMEPNPEAFYRMAYMAQSLASGLQEDTVFGTHAYNPSLADYIRGMGELGERLRRLGDIAAKELAGQPITPEENQLIAGCLGMIECMNTYTGYNRPNSEMPKTPAVAAVAGSGDFVLEVGVGKVDRIYVIVPLEDRFEVAQGGVFSYYEFSQPRNKRLTDDEWRAMLLSPNAPALPSWADSFLLPGGHSTDALAFRKGDVYSINKAGDNLNLHQDASLKSPVIMLIKTATFVEIIDGPVSADGYTWWKFQIDDFNQNTTTGWAVENRDWYDRSYLP